MDHYNPLTLMQTSSTLQTHRFRMVNMFFFLYFRYRWNEKHLICDFLETNMKSI